MTVPLSPLRWIGGLDGHLEILDQRPASSSSPPITLPLHTSDEILEALRSGSIAQPFTISLACAYALVLAARQIPPTSQATVLLAHLHSTSAALRATVPPTVHLAATVDHLLHIAERERAIGVRPLQLRLFQEAQVLALPSTE